MSLCCYIYLQLKSARGSLFEVAALIQAEQHILCNDTQLGFGGDVTLQHQSTSFDLLGINCDSMNEQKGILWDWGRSIVNLRPCITSLKLVKTIVHALLFLVLHHIGSALQQGSRLAPKSMEALKRSTESISLGTLRRCRFYKIQTAWE